MDVSLNHSALCILEADGTTVRERRVKRDPAALVDTLQDAGVIIELVSLEAGPLSQWLFDGLAEAGYPVVCCETRQTKASELAIEIVPSHPFDPMM